MNKKIWLSSPHMGGKEQEFVKEAFDNNWVAPLGPNVDGFESFGKWIESLSNDEYILNIVIQSKIFINIFWIMKPQ